MCTGNGKWVSVVATLLCLLMASSLWAAKQPPVANKTKHPAARATAISKAIGAEFESSSSDYTAPRALGSARSTSIAPGTYMGYTWYDCQANGTMGRLIDWGWDAANGYAVHTTWHKLDGSGMDDRKIFYNYCAHDQDSLHDGCRVTPYGDYSGFPGLDVTEDNRAAIVGHNNLGDGYGTTVWFDFAPMMCFFSNWSRVPDSVSLWQSQSGAAYTIWPKFRYQDIPGQTPVTHAFAQAAMPDAADPQAIYYFRKVGENSSGVWDYPPYVVDTIFDISQDVACSYTTGKVALVWTANLCPEIETCDTCSDNTGNVAAGSVQLDNDLYYQISYDYGATWEPRVNLTKNRTGEAGFRPYTDLSALITSDDDLHIGWSGRIWPEDPDGDGVGFDCHMRHWGENLGFHTNHADGLPRGNIATVANLGWDQTVCNGGSWQMNGSKMTISECNGRLYFLWVQFNDIPNGVEDDCAQRGIDGSDVGGSANGELFLSVSADWGATWDQRRNLTNTYTPGCDSATGVNGRCQSEHWPSMARHGTDYEMTSPHAYVVDPSGGYVGNHYLDVMYIDDADAGSINQDEGTWMEADVRWFRLACVEPVDGGMLQADPPSISAPFPWVFTGQQADVELTLYNYGNADANFSITIEEDDDPPGWLATSGFESGVVPYGVGNQLTGQVHLNYGGILENQGPYSGRVILSGDFLNSPYTIEVGMWVSHQEGPIPQWVTVHATDTSGEPALALTFANNGNAGKQGDGHVNLDYFDYGDCDVYDEQTEDDPYPGLSDVYLYDGSPLVLWAGPDSIMANYSMFDHTWLNGGFFVADDISDTLPDWLRVDDTISILADRAYAKFYTRDSAIFVEKVILAPRIADPQFMLQATRFTSMDGLTHEGLVLGEAIDWDIPSDSGSWNSSGFDTGRNLMYQQGSEFDDDIECQDNDLRYGGIAYISGCNGGEEIDHAHGMYTKVNSTQVYPNGSFDEDSLWHYMHENTGFTMADSTDADLHMVATYGVDQTLGPDDELIFYTLLVTGKDGHADFLDAVDRGRDWVEELVPLGVPECCTDIPGDFDLNGQGPDIADLVYMVNVMFNSWPYPDCWYAMDANCDGAVDIADLVYIVNYMFSGGPPPAPCGCAFQTYCTGSP